MNRVKAEVLFIPIPSTSEMIDRRYSDTYKIFNFGIETGNNSRATYVDNYIGSQGPTKGDDNITFGSQGPTRGDDNITFGSHGSTRGDDNITTSSQVSTRVMTISPMFQEAV